MLVLAAWAGFSNALNSKQDEMVWMCKQSVTLELGRRVWNFLIIIKQSTVVFVYVWQYNTQNIYSKYVIDLFALENDQKNKIIPVIVNHISTKSVFAKYSSNTGYY